MKKKTEIENCWWGDWQDIEIEVLIFLHDQGYSFQEISLALKRTPKACHQQATKWGLYKYIEQSWDSSDVSTLWSLSESGYSLNQIADRMGRKESSCAIRLSRVRQTRKKLGLDK